MSKVVLCLYLPTAVAALADSITVLTSIGTAKMLVETDFAKQADTLLLGEAGGPNPNPDETLTEAEFLISVLKDNGIVDELTVRAIRLQFAHITRHDTSSSDNKVLDDRMVFLEMRAQGRIVQSSAVGARKTKAKDGTTIESVDLTSEDGGFNEWLNVFWLPRVYDGKPHGAQVRLAPVPTQTKIVKDGDGARQFTRLADEGGKPVHQGMHDVPAERTKPGGYFSDGTAIADGEYVWMPFEEARRHRHKNNDRDIGLWVLFGLFVAYFVLKMVPTMISFHFPNLLPGVRFPVDTPVTDDESSRRLAEALASLEAGQVQSSTTLAEIREKLTHR